MNGFRKPLGGFWMMVLFNQYLSEKQINSKNRLTSVVYRWMELVLFATKRLLVSTIMLLLTTLLELECQSKVALRLLRRPLIFAGMMVAQGDADGCVAGVANATARVIEAAGLTIGFAEGIFGVSSCFIMVIPDSLDGKNTVLVFSDCAVSIQPTAEELAQIAISTAATTRILLSTEPKVAMLSFSTKGSASHINVDKITTATQIVRRRMPNLIIDGELQGDAALVKTVADQKLTDSPVAGNANVLIFPDLDAGNIAYKLVQYLAKAQAYGPILQGLRKPMNDMSRGASVEDLVGVAAITAVQSGGC